jgi:hypothetical protein
LQKVPIRVPISLAGKGRVSGFSAPNARSIDPYRRALLLINPVSQLSILVHDTARSLDTWPKMADKLTPLLESGPGDIETARIKHDLPRYQYFQLNSHWTNELKRSISHTISYSRRYAEIGDHEVSSAALISLVRLNEAYIRAKGSTFFNNNPFMNNPMSRDGVVSETLEHLRQNIQIGIARGDEQQIEQTMHTMSSLVAVYLSIDYSDERASRKCMIHMNIVIECVIV